MYKKIFLIFFLIIWISLNFNYSYWDQTKAERDAACAVSWDCLDKPSFTIDIDNFAVWWSAQDYIESTAEWTIEWFLQVVILKLMIVFWTISLFVMTIWWWYMILYNWKDELLTKWKSIFMAWIIALSVSLSSWILIKIVVYLIYN